jgi:nitric oxide dioxygenase
VAAGSHLPVRHLHADLDQDSFALRDQILRDIRTFPDAAIYAWYENGAVDTLGLDGVYAGLMNLDQVNLPQNATYYLCGPIPFMQATRNALLERAVPPRDIQYEVFGPDLWQADLTSEPAPGA